MRSGSWLGQTHHYSVAAVRLRAGGEFLTDEVGPLEPFLPPTYPCGAQAAASLAHSPLLFYFVSARGVGGGVRLMVHMRIFQASPSRT
jgi:hypothetical protein